jgi:hypothetical protein
VSQPSRKNFHVIVISDRGEVIHNDYVNARNPIQAAADGMLRCHLNHNIDEVKVDGELVVIGGRFDEQITGKGYKRSGTANVWFRIHVPLIRQLRRLIPDRAKGLFVSDAIQEKLERERAELLGHAGKGKYS